MKDTNLNILSLRTSNPLLYFIYNIYIFITIWFRRLRWAGLVARMEEGRNAFKILTGKPTGKRPLGKPRRR